MQGYVKCELIQTLSFGRNWSRVAPGQQFIPLGAAGEFDSHTLYTAWSGEQLPLLDPDDSKSTLFYYAGGDGASTRSFTVPPLALWLNSIRGQDRTPGSATIRSV